MAKKPSKKSAPKKSQATKKTARRYKATPEGISDRSHLIDVIRTETGCTTAVAKETMTALLATITASLKKNKRVQLIVRRHINWDHQQPDLKEDLVHLVQDIKRRICGIASAGSPSF